MSSTYVIHKIFATKYARSLGGGVFKFIIQGGGELKQ